MKCPNIESCECRRAAKKVSAILSWENTKKANIEAQLRKVEVKFHCQHIPAHSWVILQTYQYLSAIPTTALFSYGILRTKVDKCACLQEELEKKKAEYAEKMKNKAALIHKEAEEKRAMVEAKKGEELLKAEETAAKYRATGNSPKKSMGCFGA